VGSDVEKKYKDKVTYAAGFEPPDTPPRPARRRPPADVGRVGATAARELRS
jgi:hypothetical protein